MGWTDTDPGPPSEHEDALPLLEDSGSGYAGPLDYESTDLESAGYLAREADDGFYEPPSEFEIGADLAFRYPAPVTLEDFAPTAYVEAPSDRERAEHRNAA